MNVLDADTHTPHKEQCTHPVPNYVGICGCLKKANPDYFKVKELEDVVRHLNERIRAHYEAVDLMLADRANTINELENQCRELTLMHQIALESCDDYETAVALLKRENENLKEKKSCPCLHTTPCHARCTCVKPYSSRGCDMCCTYGSEDQQKANAKYLMQKMGRLV